MPPLSHRASLRKLHQISPGAKDIGTAIMPQKTFQLCKKKILNLFFKKILVLANQYFLKFWPSFTPLKGGKPLPSQSLFEDQSLTMVKEGEGDPTHGTQLRTQRPSLPLLPTDPPNPPFSSYFRLVYSRHVPRSSVPQTKKNVHTNMFGFFGNFSSGPRDSGPFSIQAQFLGPVSA